jgi:type II secretory pathway component PulC
MRSETDRKKIALIAVKLSLLAAAAMFVSFLTCAAARAFVFERTMELQREAADIVAERQPGVFHVRSRSETNGIMSFAAFGVSDSNPADTSQAVAEPAPSASIKDFKLVGTLPSVGAWIEFKNGISLMLKDHEREGYTLDEVAPEYAVFKRGGRKFTVYLTYWSSDTRRVNPPRRRRERREPDAARSLPETPVEPPEDSGVVLAEANGEEGTISRELLNELLVNPLAEVGKMRLVPADNGMMIEGMRSDSLFLKLGMQPNDVITSVNGIGINDVGNVSNVISSMLSGTRLDFRIEREGDPVTLDYAVK